jgi:hypothetical protein
MTKSQGLASKKRCFSCPVAPYIPWGWGLIFKDCPIISTERDMEECRTCLLRGHSEMLRKPRPKRNAGDRDQNRNKKKIDKPIDKEKTYIG